MRPGAIAALCIAVGALLLLVVDGGVLRVISIVLLFAAIGLGVFAIASPEFLARDRDGSG